MMIKERVFNPVYPKMDRDDRMTVKISKKEHSNIRKLRQSGLSYRKISDLYGVSGTIIYCILNPDYYKEAKKKCSAYHRGKIKSDSEFRVEHTRVSYASRKERMKKYPEFAEYYKLKNKYYKTIAKLEGNDNG